MNDDQQTQMSSTGGCDSVGDLNTGITDVAVFKLRIRSDADEAICERCIHYSLRKFKVTGRV